VLRAAVDLADAAGIEKLTMRRLAAELGVEAMTLYYHVANKGAILEAIADLVLDEIDLPSPGEPWKPALRRLAMSAYDTFLRHPWSAPLTLAVTGLTGPRMRYMEAILGTLRRAGFSADLTDHGYHALESHIMGFTLWEVGMRLGTPEELRQLAGSVLGRIPADDYPSLVEHIHQHLKPRRPGDEGEFAFGLDLLLDGLERARDAEVADEP
jgi:AcrR family transcriptional regulator